MEVRINKYLSAAGFCSRREADRLVEAGRVSIDGRIAGMGDKVSDGQKVQVDNKDISVEEEKILLVFNKPAGIVCTTTDSQGANNIVDYIGYNKRIYPIGRLDKDSHGLILMTNNGEIRIRFSVRQMDMKKNISWKLIKILMMNLLRICQKEYTLKNSKGQHYHAGYIRMVKENSG